MANGSEITRLSTERDRFTSPLVAVVEQATTVRLDSFDRDLGNTVDTPFIAPGDELRRSIVVADQLFIRR